jgi:hypothetical protein
MGHIDHDTAEIDLIVVVGVEVGVAVDLCCVDETQIATAHVRDGVVGVRPVGNVEVFGGGDDAMVVESALVTE